MVDKITAVLDLLRHRARTMNGAHPVGGGDGNTYVSSSYGPNDARLDRQAVEVIDELERQLAECRREALEEAAKIAEDEDGKITHWGEDRNTKVAQTTARAIAAAIRALPDSTPTPLQEQNANFGKEGE
ncbi:hypothetical protein [Rhizobium sp.]|uniref:hypothetical protein n=1 Tax=Rhizobium sp. TaxID=391 RepID=UPI003F7CF90B